MVFSAELVTRFCKLALDSARLVVYRTALALQYHIRMSSSHPRGGKGRGKGSGGRRGGRHNDPDVELSKTLSYILRHGAQREGLTIRNDGYVRLDDLVSVIHPLLISVSPLEPKIPLTLTCYPLHDSAALSYADPSSKA